VRTERIERGAYDTYFWSVGWKKRRRGRGDIGGNKKTFTSKWVFVWGEKIRGGQACTRKKERGTLEQEVDDRELGEKGKQAGKPLGGGNYKEGEMAMLVATGTAA